MKYIILTTKDTYQTDLTTDGIEPIETYRYLFFNKLSATYTIAKVTDENCKIRILEQSGDKTYINNIPVKFFEGFSSVEDAFSVLKGMIGSKSEEQKLVKTS